MREREKGRRRKVDIWQFFLFSGILSYGDYLFLLTALISKWIINFFLMIMDVFFSMQRLGGSLR